MKYFLPSIILFTLFNGCDLQKYTGYDHTAQELVETTQIYGYITNFYTGDSVYDARLRFGTQETLSDFNGSYALNYVMNDDEERNKPTPILISKENYYPYQKETVLLPTKNQLDFQIKYAAPIIVDTRRREADSLLVCQAIIKDYQGIETLKSIKLTYVYLDTFVGKVVDSLTVDLPLVHQPDNVTGFFQISSNVPQIPESNSPLDFSLSKTSQSYSKEDLSETILLHPTSFLAVFYTIESIDNEGYSNRFFHTINPRVPDRFLFDPVSFIKLE